MSIELKQAAQMSLEALEEIALAGMSGTGQESEEGMRDWHARQAWKFIGIAARALDPLRTAIQQAESGAAGDVAGVFIRDKYEVWHMLPPGSTSGTTLYTRPAPGVPDGHVLVPIKPTAEMMRAWNAATSEAAYLTFTERGYDAMLAASHAQKGGE